MSMNRRVLVTGSSRGIGRAIALELGRRGWDVALHYTKEADDAKSAAEELGERFTGVYQADLSMAGEAKRLWQAAIADRPLQAIVNNAGVYFPHSFTESSDEQFEDIYTKTFAINFDSPMRLCRLAAQTFLSQAEGGRILNVASRVGYRGEANAALYAASKSALINLTRSLAVELAPKNVRLFGIAPGWVETAMAREGMENRLPQILRDIPMGRMASPQDCAEAAAFLLSDGAEYLSGMFIDINGASYFH